MIPYDDLVVALAAWRQRQGLPVVQAAGAPPRPAPPPAAPAPAAARAAPPSAPPRSPARVVAAETEDFEDSALIEEAPYDPGEDYVMALGEPVEATAIGAAPEPEPVLVPKRGKRNPDW